MTTALAERSSIGKISRNRMIAQSHARGNVATMDELPECLDPTRFPAISLASLGMPYPSSHSTDTPKVSRHPFNLPQDAPRLGVSAISHRAPLALSQV